jgi:hypothetical protein
VVTHAAVTDFLNAHDIPSENISDYLEVPEIQDMHSRAEASIKILNTLDELYGQHLSRLMHSDIALRIFYSLYRYLGRYEYMSILKVHTAIKRMLSRHQPDVVYLFSPVSLSFFCTSVNIYEYCLRTSGANVNIILRDSNSDNLDTHGKLLKLIRRLHNGIAIYTRLKTILINYHLKRRNILQSTFALIKWPDRQTKGSQHGIVALLDCSHHARLRAARWLDITPSGMVTRAIPLDTTSDELMTASTDLIAYMKQTVPIGRVGKQYDPDELFKSIISDDFHSRFIDYVLPFLKVMELTKAHPLLGGVYSTTPPIYPSTSTLLTDYLLCKGLPVIGRQHGGNYGIEQIFPRHFDSDYWWCTHFLSYGFTINDLLESTPQGKPRCIITPIGTPHSYKPASLFNSDKQRNRYDILFPITNASYFHQDTLRVPPAVLARHQSELLVFLDQFTHSRILVKPFTSFTTDNFACSQLLKHSNHITVNETISFLYCLEHYKIGCIILEYLSSPLFECLKYDVEVIALTNEVVPYNHTASRLLSKRVHLVTTLEKMKVKITQYLDGALPVLRDTAFADKYLRDGGTDQAIGSVIQSILKSPHGDATYGKTHDYEC